VQATQNTTELNTFFDYKMNRGKWVVEPSIRFQYYGTLSVFSPEPRLGVKFRATERFRLKGEMGKYTQNLMATNSDLSKHSQFLEQEQLLMKDTIQELRYEKDDMLKLMSKSQAAKVLGNYNIIITTTTTSTTTTIIIVIMIIIIQKKKPKREVKKLQRSHVVLSCSMKIDISYYIVIFIYL
jgi:hypothetical protein